MEKPAKEVLFPWLWIQLEYKGLEILKKKMLTLTGTNLWTNFFLIGRSMESEVLGKVRRETRKQMQAAFIIFWYYSNLKYTFRNSSMKNGKCLWWRHQLLSAYDLPSCRCCPLFLSVITVRLRALTLNRCNHVHVNKVEHFIPIVYHSVCNVTLCYYCYCWT